MLCFKRKYDFKIFFMILEKEDLNLKPYDIVYFWTTARDKALFLMQLTKI